MLSKPALRSLWFQVHKWLGLTLAVLIIPISLTGSALVWHDWLDERLNPERTVAAEPSLSSGDYAAAARRLAAPGERLTSLTFPDGAGAVVATLAQPPQDGGGRPVRTRLHLHPQDARLLDRSASNEGLVHVMHVLHGSLMIPGVGRKIVGWIGVAMLLSSLTGLWLWWPLNGRFRRAMRWKRRPTTSENLHHQGGFWIAIPLVILSFTGAWISFPAFFAGISGDPAGPSPAERARRMGAQPMIETHLSPEAVVDAAQPLAPGKLLTITWPTEPKREWKLSFERDGGPAEVNVADASGAATPPKPPQPETVARLMRRVHDGTGMGTLWQVIIFIGGIIPAGLAVTGVIMWANLRRRRRVAGGATRDRTPRPSASA